MAVFLCHTQLSACILKMPVVLGNGKSQDTELKYLPLVGQPRDASVAWQWEHEKCIRQAHWSPMG